MSDALPPPLTPTDADLRDFRFMPLDVVRFAQSGLVTLEDPAAIVAAVLLWGASWHNVPAGSLPDDDRQLAQLSGYGRAVDAWRAIRPGALRGWIKCSDGRLYHPVVAEKVRDAWRGKLKQRWRTYTAAIRQHNLRKPDDERDAPTFEDWLDHGQPTTVVRGQPKPQQRDLDLDCDDSRAPARAAAHARVSGGENVTGDNGGESRATGANVTRDKGGESRKSHTEKPSKGQGEGQGEGESNQSPTSTTPRAPEKAEDLLGLTNRLAKLGGVSIINPRRIAMAMDTVKAWLADGIDVEGAIVPAIERRVASMRPDDTVGSLAYFDPDIRKALALAGNGRGGSTSTAAPIADRDDDDERIPRIREALRRRIGAKSYDSWLGPHVAAMHVNGDGLTIAARSAFFADQLSANFSGPIAIAAKAEGIRAVRIGTV